MKRDLGKADEIFDVPAINFFTSGNDYFGSSGSKFRYRISHTDENIVGEVWHEDLCYEKCTVTDKKEDFPPQAADGTSLETVRESRWPHKMALRKIRKHIRSLKSSKTENAALGSISEGGRLFVITYYISLSATHGHFISRQNFIPLFREYRHPKSALNGSVISSL